MRNSTAYFSGVATVFTATALGFGGALILTSATAPRSPAEPTKLERSIVAPLQAAPPADAKSAAGDAGGTQSPSQAPRVIPAQAQQSPQPSVPDTPSPQVVSPVQTPAQASRQITASRPDQSTATPAAQAPANAYARSSDEDVRKYLRKRDRHWARRHYRDETSMAAQAPDSADQSGSQSLTVVSSTQSGSESTEPQIKAPDQTSAKVDNADARRGKRKHDRRWARGNPGDNDDGYRTDDRGQSIEARDTPQQEAPPFFARRNWRPFFSDSDDD